MFRPLLLSSVFLALLAGGCAEPPIRWVHPELPSGQWSRDEAGCKRRAQAEADREIGRDQTIGRGVDADDPFRGKMAVYEAGKRATQLTNACMTAKGYVKADR